MAQTQTIITGKGDKVKLNLQILPEGVSTEPTDFTVTPTGVINPNDTSFSIATPLAVGQNIAIGQPIVFTGGDEDIRQVVFAASEHIGDGAFTGPITILPAQGTIPVGAGTVGKTKILGGRTVDRNFTTATIEALHFEDTAAYQVSTVSTKNLEIPFTADTSPGYTSFWLMQEIQKLAEPTIWFELELVPPGGFSTGLITKNCAILTDYSDTWPTEAECQNNFTIRNQGTPQIVQPTV